MRKASKTEEEGSVPATGGSEGSVDAMRFVIMVNSGVWGRDKRWKDGNTKGRRRVGKKARIRKFYGGSIATFFDRVREVLQHVRKMAQTIIYSSDFQSSSILTRSRDCEKLIDRKKDRSRCTTATTKTQNECQQLPSSVLLGFVSKVDS